ncbi:cytochrome P450 [Zychaea mexicana]|uniref:cytochrome P450 n=1 Tax=Zychaea mexicana TaxID=64656 RepID=UPI0022FED2E1|nr:cytochrome P450 [Zychaea mexicana]KAI9487912.1 cytochrome P450 [Zychaea mexicana]
MLAPIFEKVQQLFQTVEKHLGDPVALPFSNTDTSLKNILIGGGVTGLISYAVSKYIVYNLYLHPLSKIPGPPVDWIPFLGNIRELIREESGVPYKKWAERYGDISRHHGAWNRPVILVSDPDLLKQVLMTEVYDFTKAPDDAKYITRILGSGLLVSEGDIHKRHRKMLNPAFSIQAVRELTPILFVPPVQLCEKWMSEIKAKQTNPSEAVEIVVSHGLSLVALDEIGLGGFGQEFNAIRHADSVDSDTSNKQQVHKLSWAYQTLFDPSRRTFWTILGLFFPAALYVPTKQNRQLNKALRTLAEESRNIVQHGIERAQVTSGKSVGNNLLSMMIRNADEDESDQGFTVEELRNQCLTFLAAGHETTAVSLTWCLLLLAQHQDVQDALRAEVTPVVERINMDDSVFHDEGPFGIGFEGADMPSYETMNSLHLLNNVIRETARLIPVVPVTARYATKNTTMKHHFVPKGTDVVIPIVVNHHSKTIWGDDAETFRPGRWDEEPAYSKVGSYEYFPFLAGTRQCIGYRFALIELKIILAILITKFQFFEKPGFVVKRRQELTLRPVPNMTLLVKPISSTPSSH